MLLLLIFASAAIGLVEGIPLIQKKSWKEFETLICLLVIAVFLGITKILDLPTPLNVLGSMLDPLGRIIFESF